MLTPYYQQDDITIYNCDCREIIDELGSVDLVLTDPPYGISLATNYAVSRIESQTLKRRSVGGAKGKVWFSKNHAAVEGDNVPFNPAHLLKFGKLALFGANNYASALKDSYSWVVWDKRTERGGSNSFSDCELIYCLGANFKSVRIFRHMWSGYLRDSEIHQEHLHPTQKPVALMRYLIQLFKLDKTAMILDPYCGSGATLVAAKALGYRAIGIDTSANYCEISAKRLMQQFIQLC